MRGYPEACRDLPMSAVAESKPLDRAVDGECEAWDCHARQRLKKLVRRR